MPMGVDNEFLFALCTPRSKRTSNELKVIYSHLRRLEPLKNMKENHLRSFCPMARYEYHKANSVLFKKGDFCRCWYILTSGAVFVQGSMLLPQQCFGKHIPGTKRRGYQCVVLEASEMIAIDYPEMMSMQTAGESSRTHAVHRTPLEIENNAPECETSSSEQESPAHGYHEGIHGVDGEGPICMSDSISQSSFSKDMDDDEYDVDEDDTISLHSVSSLFIKDLVIDVLKKDIDDRSNDDLEILMEFTKSLRAFSNMTEPIRRSLCKVMVFAWIEHTDTVVLKDNELLDSWSVIINGQVQIITENDVKILGMGDSFGVKPTLQAQHQKGTMTTMCEDCQFFCIAQQDYYEVLHQGKENIENILNEDGEIVMVKEKRVIDNGEKKGTITIRGTADSLMKHMLEENIIDPTFIEDFLLTYRVFDDDPLKMCTKLLEWFDVSAFRDKVIKIILLWVNNHFKDFESNWKMMDLLEKFDEKLQQANLQGHAKLFNIAVTAKAKHRVVTINLASSDSELGFEIVGGSDQDFRNPIFVCSVASGSLAEESGVKRGDQLLEVNGQNFEKIPLDKAKALLKKNTDLSLTLKTNLFAFKELMAELKNPSPKIKKQPNGLERPHTLRVPTIPTSPEGELYEKHSKKEAPDSVIKIYCPDQTSRFIYVSKDTTAGDAVRAAYKEFAITEADVHDYALYKVSVQGENFVKQSKLPEPWSKLADIPLGSRYYLKSKMNSEKLLPDENIPELLKEANFTFLDLNCFEIAYYLTQEDYQLFKLTEPSNFIDDLFKRDTGLEKFREFEDLVNRELFWVVTTICREQSIVQRAKIIKHFIKIAHHCKLLKNFNSTFALVSGLGYRAVSKMKQTWEKVPTKSIRLFEELQALMDPSRNMSKYRTLLSEHVHNPPVIPYIPVVKKDLTFLHLGNDSNVEGLVNFEKMRMLSKEVRNICRLCIPDVSQIQAVDIGTLKNDENAALYKTLTRKNRRGSLNNARRMYEDNLNTRRVKQYMQQITVETDEAKLMEMSKNVELQQAISNPSQKRRNTAGNVMNDSPVRTSKYSNGSALARADSTGYATTAQARATLESHFARILAAQSPRKKKTPSSTLPNYIIDSDSSQLIEKKLKNKNDARRSLSLSSSDSSPASSPFIQKKQQNSLEENDNNNVIGFENLNLNNNRHDIISGTNVKSALTIERCRSSKSSSSSGRGSLTSSSRVSPVSTSNPSISKINANSSPRSSPGSRKSRKSHSNTAPPNLMNPSRNPSTKHVLLSAADLAMASDSFQTGADDPSFSYNVMKQAVKNRLVACKSSPLMGRDEVQFMSSDDNTLPRSNSSDSGIENVDGAPVESSQNCEEAILNAEKQTRGSPSIRRNLSLERAGQYLPTSSEEYEILVSDSIQNISDDCFADIPDDHRCSPELGSKSQNKDNRPRLPPATFGPNQCCGYDNDFVSSPPLTKSKINKNVGGRRAMKNIHDFVCERHGILPNRPQHTPISYPFMQPNYTRNLPHSAPAVLQEEELELRLRRQNRLGHQNQNLAQWNAVAIDRFGPHHSPILPPRSSESLSSSYESSSLQYLRPPHASGYNVYIPGGMLHQRHDSDYVNYSEKTGNCHPIVSESSRSPGMKKDPYANQYLVDREEQSGPPRRVSSLHPRSMAISSGEQTVPPPLPIRSSSSRLLERQLAIDQHILHGQDRQAAAPDESQGAPTRTLSSSSEELALHNLRSDFRRGIHLMKSGGSEDQPPPPPKRTTSVGRPHQIRSNLDSSSSFPVNSSASHFQSVSPLMQKSISEEDEYLPFTPSGILSQHPKGPPGSIPDASRNYRGMPIQDVFPVTGQLPSTIGSVIPNSYVRYPGRNSGIPGGLKNVSNV